MKCVVAEIRPGTLEFAGDDGNKVQTQGFHFTGLVTDGFKMEKVYIWVSHRSEYSNRMKTFNVFTSKQLWIVDVELSIDKKWKLVSV